MKRWMIVTVCLALMQHVYAQSYEKQLACNDPNTDATQKSESIAHGSLNLELIYYSRLAPDESPVVGNIIEKNEAWPGGGSGTITLKTNQPIKLESLLVPAGIYSLFFLPSKQGWILIVNKVLGTGAVYDESKDLGRVTMRVAPAANCKMLTLGFPYLIWNNCDEHCDSKNDRKERADGYPTLMLRFAWKEANYYIPITHVLNSESAHD